MIAGVFGRYGKFKNLIKVWQVCGTDAEELVAQLHTHMGFCVCVGVVFTLENVLSKSCHNTLMQRTIVMQHTIVLLRQFKADYYTKPHSIV